MASLVRQKRSIPATRRPARVGRWPLAALLLIAAFAILTLGQIIAARVQIASAGGIEGFIRVRADFRAVLTGGLMIREGNGHLLYDEAAQHEAQARLVAPYVALAPDVTLPNSHPPYESFFAAAFIGLPSAVPFAVWTLLELLALAGALWLLAWATPLGATARWLVVAGVAAFQPVQALLMLGQTSTLLLLGCSGLYAALKRGRSGWAGVALALVLLKPQLAVPTILLLLLCRAWRPLLVAAAIHGALALAVMPVLGPAWPLRYLRYLAGSATWDARMSEYPPLMHNWRGLVAHLVAPGAPRLAEAAVVALSALSLALLVGCWWRTRAAPTPRDPVWALAIVSSLLIAHHLYNHDLTLLIFPAWLIVAGATRGGWPRARLWLALVVVGSLLPSVTAALAERQAQITVPSVALLALAQLALAWAAWGGDAGAPPMLGASPRLNVPPATVPGPSAGSDSAPRPGRRATARR